MQLDEALVKLKKLKTGYYIGGIALSFAFFVLKITNGLCNIVFYMEGECGLDRREHEIMVFLAVIVFYKNRKAANWMHCLTNMFLYCKLANMFLFLRADFFAGIVYILACIVHSIFYPEPNYAESERTLIFKNTDLYEEIQRNIRITWVIYLYTSWSSDCKHVSSVFAELSERFSLPNLRFAKLDVGRWPQEAKRFRVNIHPTSRQLPTILLFKDGKEAHRRPSVWHRRAVPFVFTKDNCILAFDLNNLFVECKNNMTKHEKEQYVIEQGRKKVLSR